MLNRGYAYTTVIGHQHRGRTLLTHLATLYPHSTPAAWQQNLANHEVTLNGLPATGAELLTPGHTLIWHRPPWLEPEAPLHFQILHDDPDILAVNKPSGLPTLPGAGYLEHTLLRLVQRQFPTANPVHRLGRTTTGIVLFAKSPQAAATLTAKWNTPQIQKTYIALAAGQAPQDHYEIMTPIGQVPHPRLGLVWAADPNGKPSHSSATVLARTLTATTFAVTLHTGRPHQIRIHLASIGHPLLGDPLYDPTGLPLTNPGLPGDGGYLLHAHRLTFPHPTTGEQITLESPLPPGFAHRQSRPAP